MWILLWQLIVEICVCVCVCVCSHWTRLVLREEGRGRDKGENFWKYTAQDRYDTNGPFDTSSVPMYRDETNVRDLLYRLSVGHNFIHLYDGFCYIYA